MLESAPVLSDIVQYVFEHFEDLLPWNSVFMPPFEEKRAYSDRTVRLSVRPSVCPSFRHTLRLGFEKFS